MKTAVDVSAEFGGPDAAEKVLPHFRALKAAAKSRTLDGIPFHQYAIILRVDGAIHQFGSTGSRDIRFGRGYEFVSIDIGISREEVAEGALVGVMPSIAHAIVASSGLLRETGDRRLAGVRWCELDASLREFVAAYELLLISN
jgi:hypothetical protein